MTRSKNSQQYYPRDSYYTPEWIFEALKLQFDVDVCAPLDGIPWLPAYKHYHEQQDGLTQEWFGKVWMNPPYSQPKPWINKFVSHANGIGLIAISKSNSFYGLWNNPMVKLSVPTKTVAFVNEMGKKAQIFMPVIFIAMGEECIQALRSSGLGIVR